MDTLRGDAALSFLFTSPFEIANSFFLSGENGKNFHSFILLTLEVQETKIAEFANSVDLDEVARNEPSHLDLHCLPFSL